MTDFQKRTWLRAAALGVVAAALIVGCGKKEEPKPAPVAEAPKPEPLKIAFAYIGPVGDGGWTFAHDNARKAIEAEFGDKVKTSFVESVSESADAERNFRDLVSQGNKLIFGTTFGYMEPMLKVAADSKDVKFEHATGYKQAENMRTYDSRTYEGAYMAGIIAGKMTKTNKLGVVASIPIPEVVRNINSFTLGAQSVNPKIKTKVVWVNEWFIKTTREALEGKWTGGAGVWWGVKEGAIDIVSIAEDVPAETKSKVDEVKAGLKDGSFVIWKGPLLDNTGKTLLKKDEVGDDKFLGGLNIYVKGVEGKVPGSDKK